ncbi:Hypothetical protein AA314_00568 [Archangium gephyra]|uniref:Uncharacterized protein n=1 Tax=Archangium gephyra TaxID=48 RepID=A0AAC8Q186_9BACT|nr:Hypothetical protein AA314_00568 [Archangium gephyra]
MGRERLVPHGRSLAAGGLGQGPHTGCPGAGRASPADAARVKPGLPRQHLESHTMMKKRVSRPSPQPSPRGRGS